MKWIIALVYPVFSLAASTPTVATINGEPIYSKDFHLFESQLNQKDSDALDRYLSFRLAVQKARSLGMADEPKLKFEIDQLIYRRFLEKTALEYQSKLEVSSRELKISYLAQPMIRSQHLVLRARNSAEKSKSLKLAESIAKNFKKGKTFTQLVLDYSVDPDARRVGDLDFRGAHNIHKSFYEALNSISDGQITKPVYHQDHLHIFLRKETKAFTDAPETYRSFLKGKLIKEKELALLDQRLKQIKTESKITLSKQDKE